MKTRPRILCRPALALLPLHHLDPADPAKPFLDAIAQMLADAVLRDLREREQRSEVTERPRIRPRLTVVK